MNRRQTDIAAAVVVVGVLSLGVLTAAYFVISGEGGMPGSESGPPVRAVGPLLMGLVVASIVGGVYVFARGQLYTEATVEASPPRDAASGADAADTSPGGDDVETGVADGSDPGTGETDQEAASASTSRPGVLAVLPDDERAILAPVVESPGLTQIEVRDRSGFSRSKVSQTITDLEERGLLYREPQGRTYRVYPADDLDERG